MALDRNEIAAQLRNDIAKGNYPVNERLPSYRELAKRLGAAPNTVGEAMRLLAAEGLVQLKPNSRAVVRSREAVASSPEERTPHVRDELTQVRSELRAVRSQLNELDGRVSGLLAKLDE